MRAMQVCTGLYINDALTAIPCSSLKSPCIPELWSSWCNIKSPSAVAFVQDTVHIAVKLKTRLLRPSMMLPLGDYVAGSSHLKILHANFGKDLHGLRLKDIDLKDKQNFDAIMNIIRAAPHLENIPEAAGTRQFIEIIQCVVDSYMDKSLEPLQRIEKIWYAVFFLRFWRNWITVHPVYKVQRHFITSNAFKCIELNVHALIISLLTLKDNFEGKACFLPWILGSQSCKQAFRSVRSMSGIFSMTINFGMLCLLKRLHRLDIILSLQAQSDNLGIKYPTPAKKKHLESSGSILEARTSSFQCFTNGIIEEYIEKALKSAKVSIENLGMRKLLEKHKLWNLFKCKEADEKGKNKGKGKRDDHNDDEDDDYEEEEDDEGDSIVTDSASGTDEELTHLSTIKDDIRMLTDNNLLNPQSADKFQTSLKRISGTQIAMFCSVSPSDCMETHQKQKEQSKFTPFVQVKM